MNVNEVQERMRTKFFGRLMFFREEVDSTNDWAKEIAEMGAPEGTVIIAGTQTAGRGRLSRKWFSPRGGLWLSIILKPRLKPQEIIKLTFWASLAVAETINKLYGLKVETKWPNDILVDGRKICGVLSEAKMVGEKVTYVVIGVGINVNINIEDFPSELREKATSLKVVLGKRASLEDLLRVLLEEMEHLYQVFIEEGSSRILAKWKSYASFLGREVEVYGVGEKVEGLAQDVDDDGALILKIRDGSVKRLLAGDFSIKVKGD